MDNAKKPVSLFPVLSSLALHERCLDWATRFPFSEVAQLLHDYCGTALLCEDTIWRMVQKEALRHDAEQEQVIAAVQQGETALPLPHFVAVSDIYDGTVSEFVALTDAICVASQKPTRQSKGEDKQDKQAKRHDTDVFVLPCKDGGERFFCEGMSENWSCVSAVSAFLQQECFHACVKWSGKQLHVVAITDGAKKIRHDLAALFGGGVRVILDWYHLAKRVRENLSMVASSMTQRKEWEGQMLGLLWRGEVKEAIVFLSLVTARRHKAKVDLLGYLQKHEAEIIDYGRRQKAGKPIGSGRMEKAVDQVIGLRQKNRGMSWTQAVGRWLC